VLQVFSLIIILGFPLALVLAWAYELTPDGIKPTASVAAADSITSATGHKLNYAIIGTLLLAVMFFIVDGYVLDDHAENAVAAASAPADARPNLPEVLPNSVAVLPFENLSLDPANAFFATGFHDELLNQLAKIRDLNVIARTSMLRYAGGTKTIPEIAAELNVETVMEGTVRYADGNVRLTTQLIDAGTGAHLWSGTYTRPFENVFEIETDIAMEIAAALEAEFSLAEQQSISANSGTESPEAFALYVRAVERWQATGPTPEGLARVEADLNQVVAFDPGFAQPYAVLADIYAERLFTDIGTPDNWQSQRTAISNRAEEHANTAIRLDPSYGYPHAALGKIHQQNWRDAAAREAFDRAAQLGPNDPETLIEYAWFSVSSGRYEDALDAARRVVALDPNNADLRFRAGVTSAMAGDYDRAIALYGESIQIDPAFEFASLYRGMTLATRGRPAEALPYLQTAEQLIGSLESGWVASQLAYAYALAQRPDDARRVFDRVMRLSADRRVGPLSWAWAYLAVGDQERALEWLNTAARDRAPDEGSFFRNNFKRNSAGDPVLEQPEFVEVRSRLGFDD
jgi:TolB-like protein/Flp pilus assembly protein TadD